MEQTEFLKRLINLANEFKIKSDSLTYVSPTEETFRWDGSAFKLHENVRVSLKKRKKSLVEDHRGESLEQTLLMIDRDLSIVSYFLSQQKYLISKVQNRVNTFLPFFKEKYLTDSSIRIRARDLSVWQLKQLSWGSSLNPYPHGLIHVMSELISKRHNIIQKLVKEKKIHVTQL